MGSSWQAGWTQLYYGFSGLSHNIRWTAQTKQGFGFCVAEPDTEVSFKLM